MTAVVKRNVEVNFSHLGKDTDYKIAIQKTLYEFDEECDGPLGPMYLSLNTSLLQDVGKLTKTLSEITSKYINLKECE